MSEITDWLHLARHGGDPQALARVFAATYADLLRMARQRARADARSLTAAALVHESFLRLMRSRQLSISGREHFLACAGKAMRAVMVDHLRRRSADKRGGVAGAQTLRDDASVAEDTGSDIDDLERALRDLDAVSPRQRLVVELRFFGGFEFEDIAELLVCSLRTAKRDWERARAFLHTQLGECAT